MSVSRCIQHTRTRLCLRCTHSNRCKCYPLLFIIFEIEFFLKLRLLTIPKFIRYTSSLTHRVYVNWSFFSCRKKRVHENMRLYMYVIGLIFFRAKQFCVFNIFAITATACQTAGQIRSNMRSQRLWLAGVLADATNSGFTFLPLARIIKS